MEGSHSKRRRSRSASSQPNSSTKPAILTFILGFRLLLRFPIRLFRQGTPDSSKVGHRDALQTFLSSGQLLICQKSAHVQARTLILLTGELELSDQIADPLSFPEPSEQMTKYLSVVALSENTEDTNLST
jgi:hypothetical protein